MKPAALRSNRPPKPPISASAPGPRGPAHKRLDQIDHAVARIDIDASGRVASVFHGSTNGGDLPGGAMRGLLRGNRGVRKPGRPAI